MSCKAFDVAELQFAKHAPWVESVEGGSPNDSVSASEYFSELQDALVAAFLARIPTIPISTGK